MSQTRRPLLLRLAIVLLATAVLDAILGRAFAVLRPVRGPDDERSFRRRDPVYHHGLTPGAVTRGKWGDLAYDVAVNSLGFKDRSTRDVPLRSARPRLLFLGDSFTEGIGLAYDETFVGRLDQALAPRGIEVLNAAVASYSPSIEERKLRALLDDVGLQVSSVVVLVDVGDVEDEALDYRTDADGRIVDAPDAPLVPTVRSGPDPLKPYVERSLMLRLARSLQTRLQAATRPLLYDGDRARWTLDDEVWHRIGEPGLARAAEAMTRLADVARAHGLALAVGVYPWPFQIVSHDLDSRQVRFWRAWCEEHAVPFLDFFPTFIGDEPSERVLERDFLPGDSHLNATGHARFAAALLAKLEAAGLVAKP